jgi:hypothetical protein
VELNDGNIGVDPVTGTGVTVSSAVVRTGAFSLLVDGSVSATAAGQLAFTGAAGTTFFVRAYVQFATLTAGSGSGYRSVLVDANTGAGIVLNTAASALRFRKADATLDATTFAVTTGVWYRLEFSYQSTSGAWEWLVDGTSKSTGTTTSVNTAGALRLGGSLSAVTAPTFKAYYDDIAVNDTNAGTGQTSYPGDGNVVLLVPASDSAVGSGWTDSGGSSTGLWDSVNNKPPTGIADTTASAGHQIRNASSAASSYDANLTTYTAAGVGASDTVNVLTPFVNHGAPVVTGAKTGNFGIASNPTIAQRTFAGGVSSDFWQGNAASTYSTGWAWDVGTITYAPSVTVGTAPVARVTITGGTASRIAMVDFMGMYVDYTPATLPIPDVGMGLTVT